VFTRDYKELKGLVKKMGEININLIPRAKPIKKRPYKLAHKYKEIVPKEIKGMLVTESFTLFTSCNGSTLVVVQPKNHDPKNLESTSTLEG
jgi:hypothetical protein